MALPPAAKVTVCAAAASPLPRAHRHGPRPSPRPRGAPPARRVVAARDGSGGAVRKAHRKQETDEAVGDADDEPRSADADRRVRAGGRPPARHVAPVAPTETAEVGR